MQAIPLLDALGLGVGVLALDGLLESFPVASVQNKCARLCL
jgi:hypothetical protein